MTLPEQSTREEQAKLLFEKHLKGPNADTERDRFVEKAREGTKEFLEAIRAAEQITADERRVYINARCEA